MRVLEEHGPMEARAGEPGVVLETGASEVDVGDRLAGFPEYHLVEFGARNEGALPEVPREDPVDALQGAERRHGLLQ
ncbi:hypothetical protein GCM10027184_69870 [Saccharothrix stipae]